MTYTNTATCSRAATNQDMSDAKLNRDPEEAMTQGVVKNQETLKPNRPPRDMSMLLRPMIAGSLPAILGLLAIGCGSGNSLNADAGPDTKVAVGESPTFDGCDSSGDITNYHWVIRQAPESMPQDIDKAIRESMTDCSFTLEASMIADEIGSWTIELIVTDHDGATSSDEVAVTVVE